MNNHQTPSRPTARCKSFAALLPLLDEPDIDPDTLAEPRSHLATCAYCQEQRAAYRQLELAARRHLGPPTSPRYQTEEIMRDLLGEPVTEPITGKTTTSRANRPNPRQPGSARRLLAGLPALAVVLVIVLLAVALFANHLQFVGRSANSTPTPATGSETELRDVAMVSPTEGWVVGYYLPIPQVQAVHATDSGVSWGGRADFVHTTVVLMHYLQGRWTPVHMNIHGQLTSISMLSANDGWAVGFSDRPLNGFFLHYDGHSWKQIAAGPMTGLNLNGLQMLSDTDGWATAGGSIVHYDGLRWTAQPIPANLEPDSHYVALNSIFMTSSTAGWATGYTQPATNGVPTGSPTGVILRSLNGQWSVSRTIPNTLLGHIAMTSADDGWLIGSSVAGNESPILLHYTRNTWTQVPNPLNATESQGVSFDGISMRSPTDGWMLVGLGTNFQQPAILHYDGAQWKLETLPLSLKNAVPQIFSISMASANDGWIVGSLIPKSINYTSKPPSFIISPLLLHYHNGSWSVYNT